MTAMSLFIRLCPARVGVTKMSCVPVIRVGGVNGCLSPGVAHVTHGQGAVHYGHAPVYSINYFLDMYCEINAIAWTNTRMPARSNGRPQERISISSRVQERMTSSSAPVENPTTAAINNARHANMTSFMAAPTSGPNHLVQLSRRHDYQCILRPAR